MKLQSFYVVLLLQLFIACVGGARKMVCETSYDSGFYDPCADTDCNFACPQNGKQVTVADPDDCKSYFLCENNQLVPKTCDEGYLFNANNHKCLKARSGFNKCQPPCPNNAYKNYIKTNPTVLPTLRVPTTTTTTTKNTGTGIKGSQTTNEFPETASDSATSQQLESVDEQTTNQFSSDFSSEQYSSSTEQFLNFESRIPDVSCLKLEEVNAAPEVPPGKFQVLLCTWTCAQAISSSIDVNFTWYKEDQVFQGKISECKTEMTNNFSDLSSAFQQKNCVTQENKLGRISKLYVSSTADNRAGVYRCSVTAADSKLEYFSNNLFISMDTLLALEIKPARAALLQGSDLNLTCQLIRNDGWPVPNELCSAKYFMWVPDNTSGLMPPFHTCASVYKFKQNNEGEYTVICKYSTNSMELSISSNISVVSSEVPICPLDVDVYQMSWSSLKSKESSSQSCPNYKGLATRQCVLNSDGKAVWNSTNFTECIDEEFSMIFNKFKAVDQGWKKDNSTTIAVLTKDLYELSSPENLRIQNLNLTVGCLQLLTDFRNAADEVTKDEVTYVLKIVSRVLEISNMDSWFQLVKSDSNIATTLLSTLDLYILQIVPAMKLYKVVEQNLAIQAMKIPRLSIGLPDNDVTIYPPTGKHLPAHGDARGSVDSISMSLNFIQPQPPIEGMQGRPASEVVIYGGFYNNLEDILPVRQQKNFLGSRIVSVKISQPEEASVKNGVNITFDHIKKNSSLKCTPACVFWNYSSGENGDWSSDGCRVLWTNENMTTCSCDHMTNFAILMSIDQEVLVDNAAIRTISLIGCIVSIVALILTVIILIASWKRANIPHHYAILINLCISLIIANALFIGGIDKTEPKELCTAVAALLHFFYMSAFFLMLAEGVQLLIYVVHVYHFQKKKETILIISSAWVSALIVVGVSLLVTKTVGYGSPKSCWLSSVGGLMWAFIGPALFIIFVNLIIIFVVLWKASRRQVASEKKNVKNKIKRTTWNVVVISPLLGLTWVFGVLSVTQSLVAFQYLFAIINSFQGLFIFIFHGLLSQIRLRKKGGLFGKGSSSSKPYQIQVNEKSSSRRGTVESVCQSEKVFDNNYFTSDDKFETNEGVRKDSTDIFRNTMGSQSTESSYVDSNVSF